ncbi:MAG: type I-E CRISPR-associated protein Cse1/CasA [Myxococcales bacterium]|nr:type I-E CRISPR-associated protein Cse1/CasA [Polyangiaceae bacterium]MDW8250370.1 type I-E CRISPR-associated protein Cse1/CasA [Myxococcales bacterium]
MPEPIHNLLSEPLFRVACGTTSSTTTLPGILAALSRGEPLEFPGLRAHQQHPWHAFLCQLGALASHHHLAHEFPGEEAPWRDALLQLTDSQQEPWCLVVHALDRPAFLQPPVPEGLLDEKRFSEISTPDELDILVTSKNHDVKIAPSRAPTLEQWIFALVALQTFQGYSGGGNQGIARMNGGYGSRPHVGYLSDFGAGARFLRDAKLWLRTRPNLLQKYGYDENGIGLLWQEPWDGNQSLPLDRLDPFFLEICRRVRFALHGKRLLAYRALAQVTRIDAKQNKGNTGDLWTPLKQKDQEALSVQERGFHYTLTSRLLFGEDFLPPPAQEDLPSTAPLFWLGQVLSRQQGLTAGYHERIVPIPLKIRSIFQNRDAWSKLGQQAKDRVQMAGDARLKLLGMSLRVLLQGGPDKVDNEDRRTDRWLDAFDLEVDHIFFEHLWSATSLKPEEAKQTWRQTLVDLAWKLLQQATHEAPIPLVRRYRAIARAEQTFLAIAYKSFQSRPSLPRRSHDRDPSHHDISGTQGPSSPGGSHRRGDPPAERTQSRGRRGAAPPATGQPLLPGLLEVEPDPPDLF